MRLRQHRYEILFKIESDPEWALSEAKKIWREIQSSLGDPLKGDETIFAAMHKARIQAGRMFSSELRELSKKWLEERGWRVPKDGGGRGGE